MYNEKAERDAEIIQALYEMSAAKAARKFKISHARVRQIIQANGGYLPGMIRYKQAVVLEHYDE